MRVSYIARRFFFNINKKRPWSVMSAELASIVMPARLDLVTMLEVSGRPPPVFFSDKGKFTDWAKRHGLKCIKIDGVMETSAMLVRGEYREDGIDCLLPYEQVWVRATYTDWEKPYDTAILQSYEIPKELVKELNRDHVINKAGLKKNHPNAWVNLFPVHKDPNQLFGNVENALPKIPRGVERVDLPPIVAFKLFCGRMPKTKRQFERAIKEVKSNFLAAESKPASDYCEAIEREARKYIKLMNPIQYLAYLAEGMLPKGLKKTIRKRRYKRKWIKKNRERAKLRRGLRR